MKALSLLPLILIVVACGRGGVPNSGPSPIGSTPETQTAPVAQGTVNGGGGVGIRCGSQLEILDLFEARRSGLQPLPTPKSQAEAAELIASRIAKHFWNPDTIAPSEQERIVRDQVIIPIFEGRAFLNAETGKSETVQFVPSLPLSNDFGNYELPAGCHLEQLAYFSDDKTQLSFVKSAWDELDWLSKSALVSHEILYMVYRREGLETLQPKGSDHTSESSRKFVGRLLSTSSLPEKSIGLPPKDELFICSTDEEDGPSTYAYAYDDKASGKLRLVFNIIQRASSFYQLRAHFKASSVSSLVAVDATMTEETAALEANGSNVDTNFKIKISRDIKSGVTLRLEYSENGLPIAIGKTQTLGCSKF